MNQRTRINLNPDRKPNARIQTLVKEKLHGAEKEREQRIKKRKRKKKKTERDSRSRQRIARVINGACSTHDLRVLLASARSRVYIKQASLSLACKMYGILCVRRLRGLFPSNYMLPILYIYTHTHIHLCTREKGEHTRTYTHTQHSIKLANIGANLRKIYTSRTQN